MGQNCARRLGNSTRFLPSFAYYLTVPDMKFIQTLLILLFACSVMQAQTSFDTVKIRPQRLADNIYMLKGSGGNIGLLTGSDGLLMIDDQFAPLSEKIKEAIKAIDAGKIQYLVNSHLHGDHSGGNEN